MSYYQGSPDYRITSRYDVAHYPYVVIDIRVYADSEDSVTSRLAHVVSIQNCGEPAADVRRTVVKFKLKSC